MAYEIGNDLHRNPRYLTYLIKQICDDLTAINTNIAEFRADHATFKTAADQVDTLIEELHDDHATIKTWEDAADTAIEELIDDHATFKSAVDASNVWCTEVDADLDVINNQIDFLGRGNQVVGGNFTITAGAAVTLTGAGFVTYAIDGDIYYTDLDTTITLQDGGDIAAGNWGAWRILIDRLGVVTTQDTGGGAGAMAHANEEDALLCLSAIAPTANNVTIGYFTIHSNGGYNIGTDNVNGETAANVYHVRGRAKKVTGLTANLGAAVVADAGAGTWSCGTIDFKRNGLRLAQIAAIANQAVDDADTIADGNAGAWLLVTNLAGTGVYLLAANGVAGAVSAMTYANAAAANTAIDTLTDNLPELFCPIGKILVENATGGLFTAGATNWDAVGATTTPATGISVVWDRTANTGYGSHRISPPAIPATVTAPIPAAGPATLAAAKPGTVMATLTASKPANAPATLSASAVTLSTSYR